MRTGRPSRTCIDDCVHCGFCLPTCPTYALWGAGGRLAARPDRADQRGPSARGGELSDELVTHIDRCLGCMACVTACPSGVRYDRLIERCGRRSSATTDRSRADRALRLLLFETLPHPKRLRALAPVLAAARATHADRRLPRRLAALAKVAPRVSRRSLRRCRRRRSGPRRSASSAAASACCLGCVQRVFYSQVHRATVRALAAEGFEVLAPRVPDCCGALELHARRGGGGAPARAASTVQAFAQLGGLDYVVVNAAGCGSAMKEYGDLLGTPAAQRILGPRPRRVRGARRGASRARPAGPVPLRVAYHDACHLAHAQGIRSRAAGAAARRSRSSSCWRSRPSARCAAARPGSTTSSSPRRRPSSAAARPTHLLETGAQAIAAGNPGCAAQLDLHLRELGRPLPVHHPVELVWRSIAAAAAPELVR